MILKNYLKGGVMILKKGGSMILKKSWLWWGHVSEKSQLIARSLISQAAGIAWNRLKR
jgi:hypothetical protein